MKTINLLISVGSLCLSSLVYSAEATSDKTTTPNTVTERMTTQRHAQCSHLAYLFTRDPSHTLVQLHMNRAVEIGKLPLAEVVYQMGLVEGMVKVVAKLEKTGVSTVAKVIYKDLCTFEEV